MRRNFLRRISILCTGTLLNMTIDTVDLLSVDAAEACRAACEDVGFFYLTNHGVPFSLIERTFEASRAFFELPKGEKAKVKVNEQSKGWTDFGEETLDPTKQSVGGTKEGYYIGRELSNDDPELASNPLVGYNQWPGAPLGADWRETMLDYHAALSELGLRVVRLLAQSLGLPPKYFDAEFEKPMARLRLLRYSDHTSDPDRGVFAAGAHIDNGMITLLLTDAWIAGQD